MKKVFVCSPYRGNIELNRQRALEYCRYAAVRGYLPIAPHLYFTQFLSEDNDERDLGISMGLELMDICDEVWVCGEHISDGMRIEIEYAKSAHKPIYYINKDTKSP